MSEIRHHTKPEGVWLFDYPSLLSMDDCPKYVVSLSERDINIIWQSIINIDKFRSRVFISRRGNSYEIVDLDQFGLFKEWVSNLNVNMGDFMTCSTALEQIAAALELLANRECCPTGGAGSGVFNSGSRGAGITPQPINTFEEDLELEQPPVGFDDWASYRLHKCNASADLVHNLKIDLLSLSNLIPTGKMFTVIVGELVAVLLTPIPFDDVASLVGWLVVGAFEYSLLAELSTGVQDDEDNLKCILYNASNATNAQDDFRTRITELISDVTGLGPAQSWMESIVDNLTPSDAFNRMFVESSTVIQDADCSACVADWVPVEGIYAAGNLAANPMTVESVYLNGLHRAYICRETGTDNVTFGPATGFTPAPSTGGADDAVGVATEGCSGTVTYSLYLDDDYPEDETFNGAAFIGLNSTTEFSFQITKS